MSTIDDRVLVTETAWWWLSFCDTSRPRGQQFLGVCIVEGCVIAEAAARAWALKCNPGGQGAGAQIPPSNVRFLDASMVNRLLTRDEAIALDDEVRITMEMS